MMTLTEAKTNNLMTFQGWRAGGQHEADDTLNDSNRNLIKAYAAENPHAMCFKFHRKENNGIFKPTEQTQLYNFCCDWIFNGTEENLVKVTEAAQRYNKSKSINDLNRLTDILESAGGVCLVWS